MKRALLFLLLTAACHRKPVAPSPIVAPGDPATSDSVTPPAQRYAENSGTLLLPPPKPRPVRPRPADETTPAPRPAAAPVPPPSVEPTPSDGARLPLWKQRAKFY